MVELQARLDAVITRLRDQGHRLTPQRMAVIKALIGKDHLSVEQIYERVKVDFPMTSLTTIYKTVAVLKEMGEVSELGFSGDSSRYNSNLHPHPHLICIKCKEILDVDVEVDVAGDLPQVVARRTGYRIVNHRFDFFGVCPRCQEDE